MDDALKDFKPTTVYEVVVKKTTTYVKTDGSSYEKIGTHQEANDYNKVGDAKYDNVRRPPYVTTKTEEIYTQSSDKVNVMALVATVNGVEWK